MDCMLLMIALLFPAKPLLLIPTVLVTDLSEVGVIETAGAVLCKYLSAPDSNMHVIAADSDEEVSGDDRDVHVYVYVLSLTVCESVVRVFDSLYMDA